MGEGSNCCKEGSCCKKKLCGLIIFILLLLNTFFLAGIWRSLGGVCPFTGKVAWQKMCPMLNSSAMKGSMNNMMGTANPQ